MLKLEFAHAEIYHTSDNRVTQNSESLISKFLLLITLYSINSRDIKNWNGKSSFILLKKSIQQYLHDPEVVKNFSMKCNAKKHTSKKKKKNTHLRGKDDGFTSNKLQFIKYTLKRWKCEPHSGRWDVQHLQPKKD